MENKNENKKSKLVFDPRIGRKLLKMNDEIRFCPFCGKSIDDKCDCHKNLVLDIKPYKTETGAYELDKSVFVFQNNESFQADLTQIIEELKSKKESEVEQPIIDLD